MKHILLLASIALVTLVSSCKKDEKPEELIIGKWNVSKLIVDADNVVGLDGDYKTEIELEFTSSGTLIFNIKETDYSITPAAVDEYTIPGTYSWNGGKITISIDDSGDLLSITGNVDVSTSSLVINATSGDVDDFFSLLEADKI